MSKMVEVGENFKRAVTEQDADLYSVLRQFIEESTENKVGQWYIGWEDIGNLSTYLVENYNIRKKDGD